MSSPSHSSLTQPPSPITPNSPKGVQIEANAPNREEFYAPPPPPPQSSLSKIRDMLRAPIAEFAGTAVFVALGTGVDCAVTLSADTGVSATQKGSWLSVNFGWAIGLALGAWIAGGISGGHLNPAITLGMAAWRKFSWAKVPLYIFAQLLGGVVGAAITYGNYINAIDVFEGGPKIRTVATASMFATYPLPYTTNVTAFFSEFLGTALLALMVIAATDKGNNATPHGLFPITLFLTLLGLSISFGIQTSFGFNPARDFGPRLFLTMAGYGKQLYNYRKGYWIWGGILAPFVGAQVGMGFYNIFLYKPEQPTRIPLQRKNTDVTLTPYTVGNNQV